MADFDKSLEYIKMCEKATEIQKEWRIKGRYPEYEGSFYYSKGNKCARCVDYEFPYHEDNCDLITTIWLPRQDQLQEIAITSIEFNLPERAKCEVLTYFDQWCFNSIYWRAYAYQFASMEQLWLAFVMKECWNLVWNGEDWVKEN